MALAALPKAQRHVRFTPESGHVRCKHQCPLWAKSGHHKAYSITSSAISKNVSRIGKPRSLAVLRLLTSSNLVGDCAGRSPGDAPLRMRSMYSLERRKISPVLGPYDIKPPSTTNCLYTEITGTLCWLADFNIASRAPTMNTSAGAIKPLPVSRPALAITEPVSAMLRTCAVLTSTEGCCGVALNA